MKLKIEKLDYEGRGLSHENKMVTFIPYTLPGEVVEMQITDQQKNYQLGELTKIYEQSPDRLPPFCPYFKTCGGCTFAHTSYQKSLKYKKDILIDQFQKSKLEINELEIVESRPVLEYRNKITLHIKEGKIGYYKENTHDLVEIEYCLLADPCINLLLKELKDFHILNGKITIRTNSEKELLLIIETKDPIKIKEDIVKKHKIKGILLNHKCVYKDSYLIEKRNNINYKIHGESFFQVNPYISEQIKKDILSYFNASDTVFDLYCGIGFFTFPLAQKVKKVIGIEQNPYAIKDALKIKEQQHYPNISFHLGKVEDIIMKIPLPFEKAIIDPPRSGLQKKVIKYLNQANLNTLIYISCNPKTLIRDLLELTKVYKISSIKGYDMFAYTKHVECVCVLERR